MKTNLLGILAGDRAQFTKYSCAIIHLSQLVSTARIPNLILWGPGKCAAAGDYSANIK